MKTRSRVAGIAALVAATAVAFPSAAMASDGPIAAAPSTDSAITPPKLDAQVCDTRGFYQVRSKNYNDFLGLGNAVTYRNQTPNQQNFSRSLSATGSASFTVSAGAEVDAGAVFAGVKASVSASVTTSVSGTATLAANMVVSPWKTGELRAGIGRVTTTGTYTAYYSNCSVRIKKDLSATAPTGWTFTAKEY